MLPLLLALATPADAGDRRTPVVEAVERATPGVVAIETEIASSLPFGFSFFDEHRTSEGSGVVIDPAGVVLTNAHVVEGALSITAHGHDGRTWPATLVALEPDLDLAVLQLRGGEDLPTVPIGDSDDLLLGEPAIAIGNPYGLGLTVSTGVISSVNREVQIRPGLYQSYIQTDAAINPGNSGGALVNIDGELVGINTFIHGGAQGIGFAIPANRARKVADDLVHYGAVRMPWLGADFRDVSPRRLAGTPLEKGAILVERVHPDGPAARAGLRVGDLVYRVNGRSTASRADLNAYLADKTPGATVTLAYVRGATAGDATVDSVEAPAELGRRSREEVLGVSVTATDRGLVVTGIAPGGSWSRARLRPGDVIAAVDGARVDSVDALDRALARAKGRHRPTALFTVVHGRYRASVTLPI